MSQGLVTSYLQPFFSDINCMKDDKDIDWNNLSFDDLERIDWENIPAEHVPKVADMMCKRKLCNLEALTGRSMAKLTDKHYNTITNKINGKSNFSWLDFMIMFAVQDMPKEDIDAMAKFGGKLNLKRLWEFFK